MDNLHAILQSCDGQCCMLCMCSSHVVRAMLLLSPSDMYTHACLESETFPQALLGFSVASSHAAVRSRCSMQLHNLALQCISVHVCAAGPANDRHTPLHASITESTFNHIWVSICFSVRACMPLLTLRACRDSSPLAVSRI